MTFWVQHGYGKGSKIDTLTDLGLLRGIILSPGDEVRSTLDATVQGARSSGINLLLDPQLYVSTIGADIKVARRNRLEGLGLDFGEVPISVASSDINNHVTATLRANRRLGIETTVAPSPYMPSLGDDWAAIGLQYAEATVNAADHPVYISLVVEAAALTNWGETMHYLSALTKLEAVGIYLIIGNTGSSYPLRWVPEQLAKVLRLVYILSEENRYETVWGYSDLAGVLGLVCGANGAATGWYHTMRMWTTGKWTPGVRRQPNPRMFLEPLLSSVQQNEARSIVTTSHGRQALAALEDRQLLTAADAWERTGAQTQHLGAIARLHHTVDRRANIADRVREFRRRIANAVEFFDVVVGEGAYVERAQRTRLTVLSQALDIFLQEEEI